MRYWAKVNTDNVVISVECASPEWVSEWIDSNPNSEFRYIETFMERRDYAGINYTWDDTLERFIPPVPGPAPRWVYDVDEWRWVDTEPPPRPLTEGDAGSGEDQESES